MEPIEGAPGYFVDCAGNVYNSKGYRLKPYVNDRGYVVHSFQVGNRVVKIKLHRILATAFIPREDSTKTMVDHINRDRADNRLCNLRWVNSFENSQNRSTPRTNTSGAMGVHAVTNNGVTYWKAALTANRLSISKLFPHNPEGFAEACQFRLALKTLMHAL